MLWPERHRCVRTQWNCVSVHSTGSGASWSALRGQTAEAAVAVLEILDGRGEMLFAEVGPEDGSHEQLGIGGLPEKEVGDAHLAGGADHQVEFGKMGGVEPAADRVLVDVLLAGGRGLRRGGDERLAAAVVESEGQLQAGVIF